MKTFSRRDILCEGAAGVLSTALLSPRAEAWDVQSGLANQIDVEKLVRWTLELGDIYSPTGHEGHVADYLHEQYGKLGLARQLQPIADGRSNAIGYLEGSGRGYTLMFNGHMDTFPFNNADERSRIWGDTAGVAEVPSGLPVPRVINREWICAYSIRNMKSALAAYLGALDAVVRSGLRLTGNVIIAGVAGADPTSAWTNGRALPLDEQLGVGTKYMLDHGTTAHMCILGEPTSLELVPAHLGRVRIRLTLRSDDSRPPDAQLKQIIAALEAWLPSYQEAHRFKTVLPGAFVAATDSRVDYPRGEGNVYIEFRTIPGQHALDIVDEVRHFVSQHLSEVDRKHNVRISPLLIEPATEISPDSLLMPALQQAHHKVTDVLPTTTYVPWGADATRLSRAGIATIIYGPGGLPSRKVYAGASELGDWDYQSIPDLVTAARVYAVLIADLCSRVRP